MTPIDLPIALCAVASIGIGRARAGFFALWLYAFLKIVAVWPA